MSKIPRGLNPRRREGGILSHGKRSKYTGVRIPVTLRADLEAIAEREHITLSKLIVEVLREYMKEVH